MSKHHEQQSRPASSICLVTHTALRLIEFLKPPLHRAAMQKPMCRRGKLKVPRKEALGLGPRREDKETSIPKLWQRQVAKREDGRLGRGRRALLLLQLPLNPQQERRPGSRPDIMALSINRRRLG